MDRNLEHLNIDKTVDNVIELEPKKDLSIIQSEINSLSPSIKEYIDEGLYSTLSNKEKDELREFSRQLAKNPKHLEFIKKWLLEKRNKKR